MKPKIFGPVSLQRIFLRLAAGVALLTLLMAPVGGLAHEHSEWSDPECRVCHVARSPWDAPTPAAAPPPAPPETRGSTEAEDDAVARGETTCDSGGPRAPPA